METILKKYTSYVLIVLMVMLLLCVLCLEDFSFLFWFLPFLFFLLIGTLFVDHTKVLYLLILIIPLSVPLPMNAGTVVMFPSEILVALLMLYGGVLYLFIQPVQKKIILHPVSLLLVAEICWSVVCSFTSDSPEIAIKRTLVNVAYVVVYFFLLVQIFGETKMIKQVYGLSVAGLVIPVLYTLYVHAEFDFSLSVSSILARPFYNDHTIYGAVLCFFIPYLIYMIHEQRKSIPLLGFLALTVLVFIGFFFSYSRAAWLSLAVAGVFYVFMQIRYKLLLIFGLLILIGITISFSWESISTVVIGSTAISNRENISEHVQSVTNINSDVSNAERINRWKCALRMFADKPLTGFGPGTYQFYYGSYQIRTDMTRISTYQGDRGHAHSEYLNRLSETGWLGLLLFITTAFFVFLSAWRIEQNTTSPIVRNLTRVSILALFTFYIHGFFNGFSDTDKMAMPVYAAMAAIVAMEVNMKNKTS